MALPHKYFSPRCHSLSEEEMDAGFCFVTMRSITIASKLKSSTEMTNADFIHQEHI